jgi:glycine cleavage system H protein
MNYPDELRYHREDTWARTEDDGKVRIGITDFAQLGDIVFVDLPEPGVEVSLGNAFGEIESSKTVADLIAPASGVVVEVNTQLEQKPELVNADPYGAGWIALIEASQPIGAELLDATAYQRDAEGR